MFDIIGTSPSQTVNPVPGKWFPCTVLCPEHRSAATAATVHTPYQWDTFPYRPHWCPGSHNAAEQRRRYMVLEPALDGSASLHHIRSLVLALDGLASLHHIRSLVSALDGSASLPHIRSLVSALDGSASLPHIRSLVLALDGSASSCRPPHSHRRRLASLLFLVQSPDGLG